MPVVQTFHALGSVKRRHQGAADTSPPQRIELRARRCAAPSTTSSPPAPTRCSSCAGSALPATAAADRAVRRRPRACSRPRGPVRRPAGPGRGSSCSAGWSSARASDDAVRALAALPDAELRRRRRAAERGGWTPTRTSRRLRALAEALGVADRLVFTGSVAPRRRAGAGALGRRRRRRALVRAVRDHPARGDGLRACRSSRTAVGGLRRHRRRRRHRRPRAAARPGPRSARRSPRCSTTTTAASAYGRAGVRAGAAALPLEPRRRRHRGRLRQVLAAPARGGRPMSAAPHSFSENAAAEVPSPDACTHLTGADHLASLAAALRRWTRSSTSLDRLGRGCSPTCWRRRAAAGRRQRRQRRQAQHLTAELVGRYRDDRPPFSRDLPERRDLVADRHRQRLRPTSSSPARSRRTGGPATSCVLLSTSRPVAERWSPRPAAARECGLTVLALTGPAPNPLADAADDAVCVDSPSTATVQECHLVALHLVCAALRRGGAAPSRRGCRPSTGGGRASEAALVVVGDALLDRDVVGTASRLTPDAPVPVVEDVERTRAARRRRAGRGARRRATRREVVLVTPLDADEGAARLRALLAGRVALVAIPASRRHGGQEAGARAAATRCVRLDSGARGRDARARCRPRRADGDPDGRRRARRRLRPRGRRRRPTCAPPWPPPRGPVVWDPHPRGADPVPGRPAGHPERRGGRSGRRRCAVPRRGRGLAAVGARARGADPALGRRRGRGDARRARARCSPTARARRWSCRPCRSPAGIRAAPATRSPPRPRSRWPTAR